MNLKDRYRGDPAADVKRADGTLAALTDVRHWVAEQRVAAERLAADASRFEDRLALRSEPARDAAEHADARAPEPDDADGAAARVHASARGAVQGNPLVTEAFLVEAPNESVAALDRLLTDSRIERENLEQELRAIRERLQLVAAGIPAWRPVTVARPAISSPARSGAATRGDGERKPGERGGAERSSKGGGLGSLWLGCAFVGIGSALAGAAAFLHFVAAPAAVSDGRPNKTPTSVVRLVPAAVRPAHDGRVTHRGRRTLRPIHLAAAPQSVSLKARALQPVRSTAASYQVDSSAAAAAAPPRIALLSMLPKRVVAGKTATLCISANHARRLFIAGMGAFDPNLTTCRTFSPKRTTRFVAFAVNARGQFTKRKVTVVVEPRGLAR